MMIEIRQGQEKRIQATNESVTDQLKECRKKSIPCLIISRQRRSVAGAWHEMLDLFYKEKHHRQIPLYTQTQKKIIPRRTNKKNMKAKQQKKTKRGFKNGALLNALTAEAAAC